MKRFALISLLALMLAALALITSPLRAQAPGQSSGAGAPVDVPAVDANGAADQVHIRTEFKVRYVNEDEVYIDAGRDAGLTEGSQLELRKPFKSDGKPEVAAETKSAEKSGAKSESKSDTAAESAPGFTAEHDENYILAQLTVVSIANTSAVCEVKNARRALVRGDVVTLAQSEVQKIVEKQTLGNTRVFPMIVSFTSGDPLDEEIREAVPQPPIPEINQIRGRFGFDWSELQTLGANSFTTTTLGMVVRIDASRLYGTHWNLNGFWRGNLQSSSATYSNTLQNAINRTYQMSMTYVNPQARWTAGFGRLYLPWATSLEVIDGGYYGRFLNKKTIAGVFAGSTPDPTAWNYNPKNKIGGLFMNTHGGDFDSLRYSFTFGGGVRMTDWNVNNPFGFTESDVSYKHYFNLYHSMQIDQPTANPGSPAVNMGLGQSLLSMRVQAGRRVSLDLTHTYFRDVPTYDPILVGTGLLDKYLFQGISGGARFELPMHMTTYFTVGQSNASTDSKGSSNYMYGASMNRIWKTGMSVDMRVSKFNSIFAGGQYKTLTLSRDLSDRFRLNVQGGRWSYSGSTLTANNNSWFVNASLETNLGPHYFFETSFNTQRGGSLDYNQWISTFGYRFDNRAKRRINALAQTK